MRRIQALVLASCVVGLAGCSSSTSSPRSASPAAAPTTTVVTTSVRITRTPGLYILPQIDRTITDAAVAARLAMDIEQLPLAPSGPVSCPADFGTSYTLTFNVPGASAWTAIVHVTGCLLVTLSDGPARSAPTSTSLYTDLGAALGLVQDELDPRPCPVPPGEHCYAQATP